MKENYELAYDDYKTGMKYKEIAGKYNVTINTVKSWKTRHWNKLESVHTKDRKSVHAKKRKRGGQPGNKNATGPPGNQNAMKHGFFSKWLPEETKEIIGDMPDNSLDLLWANIQLQIAAIVRAQHISYVKNVEDKTVQITSEGDNMTSYNIQEAWDKQASFISAQSRAMSTLTSMIKNYEELIHTNWDISTEEQKARLGLLQAQKNKLESDGGESDQLDKLDQLISGIDEVAKK